MAMVHGRDIELTLEGRGPIRAGFLATRIVAAESAEEAKAAAVAGMPFVELCKRLVKRAKARPSRVAPAALPMPE